MERLAEACLQIHIIIFCRQKTEEKKMLPDLTPCLCQEGCKRCFLQSPDQTAKLQFVTLPTMHLLLPSKSPSTLPLFSPHHKWKELQLTEPRGMNGFHIFLDSLKNGLVAVQALQVKSTKGSSECWVVPGHTTSFWNTSCWQMFNTAAMIPKSGQIPAIGEKMLWLRWAENSLGQIFATGPVLLSRTS